ncbi:MAG: hypothetical protein ACR2NN_25540 [Bryobacteraceae bacterium]
MIRTQVQFTESQMEALRTLSVATGQSIAQSGLHDVSADHGRYLAETILE